MKRNPSKNTQRIIRFLPARHIKRPNALSVKLVGWFWFI